MLRVRLGFVYTERKRGRKSSFLLIFAAAQYEQHIKIPKALFRRTDNELFTGNIKNWVAR